MRVKTNFAEQPRPLEIKDGDKGQFIVCFRQNIEAVETEEGTQYTADEYILTLPVSQSLKKRIEENYDAWLEKAMQEDYDRAAAEVREVRDRLLADTDKEMVLDRMGLEAPTGSTFTAWLAFLKTIGEAVAGSMAQYRQELRDLTKQPGFPYDVNFPEKPQR